MNKQLLLGLMVLFGLSISCSSDDDGGVNKGGEEPPKGEELLDGGTIYTAQLVTIDKKGVTSPRYEATFNDYAIEVASTSDTTLVFLALPDLVVVGEENVLKIPDLDLYISYEVKQTEMTATAAEVLAPLLEDIRAVDTGEIEEDGVKEFFEGFDRYYASLSGTDKQLMAEVYTANFTSETSDLAGRISLSDILNPCQTNMLRMGIAAVVAVYTAEVLPLSVLFSAIALVKFRDTVRTCREILTTKLKNTFLKFKDALELKSPMMSQRVENGKMTFTAGVAERLTFDVGMRGLQTSDAEGATGAIAACFEAIESLNAFVTDKLNVAIAYYNETMPDYFSVSSFEVPVPIPGESMSTVTEITTEFYEGLSFTVADENVIVQEISYSNGMVQMTLGYADPELAEGNDLETSLHYTYTDAYNSTEGSLPVKVQSPCSGSDLAVTTTISGNTVTAVATGGVPPYTYQWSTGAEGSSVNGLEPGAYTVFVTDNTRVCAAEAEVTLGETFVYEGTWVINIYDDGVPYSTLKFTLDSEGNSITSQVIIYSNGAGWGDYDPVTMQYFSNANTVVVAGLAFTVNAVNDTIFQETRYNENNLIVRVLERQ